MTEVRPSAVSWWEPRWSSVPRVEHELRGLLSVRAWIRILAVSGVLVALVAFFAYRAVPDLEFPWLLAFLVSFGTVVLVCSARPSYLFPPKITVDQKGITIAHGHITKQYSHQDIESVHLVVPEETRISLWITTGTQSRHVGVSTKVNLHHLARLLGEKLVVHDRRNAVGVTDASADAAARLTTQEEAARRPELPAPVPPAGTPAAQTVRAEPGADPRHQGPDHTDQGTKAEMAEVRSVPEPHAGTVLTRKGIAIAMLCGLLPLAMMLGGLGMAVAGAHFASADEGNGAAVTSQQQAVGVALVVVGVVVAILGGYLGLTDALGLTSRCLCARARSQFALRPDRLVDPDDPEAMFIEVVPRENWNKLMLETATDVGFLRVDEQKGELRFEGDRERWRIPAGAIRSCELTGVTLGAGAPGPGSITYYVIVLRAEHPDPDWERPIAPRGGEGLLGRRKRLRRAQELQAKILALSGLPSPEPQA